MGLWKLLIRYFRYSLPIRTWTTRFWFSCDWIMYIFVDLTLVIITILSKLIFVFLFPFVFVFWVSFLRVLFFIWGLGVTQDTHKLQLFRSIQLRKKRVKWSLRSQKISLWKLGTCFRPFRSSCAWSNRELRN